VAERTLLAACAFGVAALASATLAAQDRYAGPWTIVRGDPAPWVGRGGVVDPAEVARLVGSEVVFEAKRIRGPWPLACAAPRYALAQVPPEGLFQGSLAAHGDPSAGADALATRLGFAARPIATLGTGCEGAIDFHATGDDELLFALDNVIYRLHRAAAPVQPPRSPP